MSKIDLGRYGAVLNPSSEGYVEAAVELEKLGFSTIWITGGPLGSLDQIAAVVRATSEVRVASSIIPVIRFPAEDVVALYTDLEKTHPGRFVVGLGGAHGPDPFGTLGRYLDALDAAVPREARLLAALGPRMLKLAHDRSSGAIPILFTPEHTAEVRTALGADTTLALAQAVVVEADPQRARELARGGSLAFLSTQPAYQASFRRQGFTDDEIARLDDRLVDALVAWGPTATITARLDAQLTAGADHLALMVTAEPGNVVPIAQWHALAAALPA
ncbi:TIGR03620 family F420-dependent LLM class oxidoreductase [Parafrankia discariae]|uniref:TIGR03620 family F420-dependent LLM class oxidoreductase n=1 Tax=Parafrankia discariae TaxID=365528 RepID=UPI000375C408|nr:TIGR03620 family F420-dependent LLM class oxidoreductase [Parafrankia discariae]